MDQMISLVTPFKEAMSAGDVIKCGELMDRNWELKQKMAPGISNPHIKQMYEKAKNGGALAGKIAGAGGGGFLLLVVPREKQNKLFEAMDDFRELPFMIEESGSKVIFDDRTYSSK
jgi:D-glycero-alpha-D-manno-heptose-7-phosphate kinase